MKIKLKVQETSKIFNIWRHKNRLTQNVLLNLKTLNSTAGEDCVFVKHRLTLRDSIEAAFCFKKISLESTE
jgi:hypothetical protein